MEKYTEAAVHRRPQNEVSFVASLTPKEKELHKMAERILGSSYFMDRTHSYNKWQQKQLRN